MLLGTLIKSSPHSPTCFRLSSDGGLALDLELQSMRLLDKLAKQALHSHSLLIPENTVVSRAIIVCTTTHRNNLLDAVDPKRSPLQKFWLLHRSMS